MVIWYHLSELTEFISTHPHTRLPYYPCEDHPLMSLLMQLFNAIPTLKI